jgi:hypothetical protein
MSVLQVYSILSLPYIGLNLDAEGVLSLAVTAILLYVVCWKCYNKNPLKLISLLVVRSEGNKISLSRTTIVMALAGAGLIAIWLVVRVVGLSIKNYLFIDNFQYAPYDILTIISYILIASLCFNLTRNIRESMLIKNVAKATIQALLITLIVLVPRYGDASWISNYLGDHSQAQGVVSFCLIAITLSIVIAAVAVVWKYIGEEK